MKSTRLLVLIVLVATVLGGWGMLARTNIQTDQQYHAFLDEARAKAKLGVTEAVVTSYRGALDIRVDPEVADELALYVTREEDSDTATDILDDLVSGYPEVAVFYEQLALLYVAAEEYDDAFALYRSAESHHVSSAVLTEGYDKIEYAYDLGSGAYEGVVSYGAGAKTFAAIGSKMSGEDELRWQLVGTDGRQADGVFDAIGSYYDGQVSVVADGLPFFVDGGGEQTLVARHVEYVEYGTLASGIFPATLPDGTTVYLSTDFTPMYDGKQFDEAGAFINGLAATRSGTEWSMIGTDGIQVGGPYDEIAIDDRGGSYGQERYFARTDGAFHMYDAHGAQVGAGSYTDARPFTGGTLAAVKVDDLWGFVDAEGAIIVAPAFEDARSFVNGLAAVKVDGSWGYVDTTGELVIPARFTGALDFSVTGSAFVATAPAAAEETDDAGAGWHLLQLYRLEE